MKKFTTDNSSCFRSWFPEIDKNLWKNFTIKKITIVVEDLGGTRTTTFKYVPNEDVINPLADYKS